MQRVHIPTELSFCIPLLVVGKIQETFLQKMLNLLNRRSTVPYNLSSVLFGIIIAASREKKFTKSEALKSKSLSSRHISQKIKAINFYF